MISIGYRILNSIPLLILVFGTAWPNQVKVNSIPVISLDQGKKYQTITGWEATAEAGQFECAGFDKVKNEIFDLAVNDLGINRIRLPVRSGVENPVDYFSDPDKLNEKEHFYEIVNDNDDPFNISENGFIFTRMDHIVELVVLPMKKRLEARGEKLFLNVNYTDFGRSDFEHADYPEEYAEFVLATYLHLQQKYKLVPDAWEVILEPNSNTWTAENIGRAIAATAKRLIQHGYKPAFIAPSSKSMSQAHKLFLRMVTIEGVLPYIIELSYHRYVGVGLKYLRQTAVTAAEYGVQTSMLEHIGSSYEDLHEDLKIGMNSAWQQYALAYCGKEDRGGSYYRIHNQNPEKPTISMNSRTKFLRQYFKFIRSGAVRFEATTTNEAFDPLAFTNRDGSTVVVIKASEAGSFDVKGLPAGKYGIKYTTTTEYDKDLPVVSVGERQTLRASIPQKGVISIYTVQQNNR